MTLKEKFIQFDQIAPVQNATILGKQFQYRYYKNPNKDKKVNIVLLAGGSGMGDGFFYMYDYFINEYNLLSFNYPMDFKDNNSLSDAIAELIKHLNLTNVYLMGQSYGGFLAQIIASRYPEVIKGLILSGTAGLGKGLSKEDKDNYNERFSDQKMQKNIKADKKIPMWALVFMFKIASIKLIKDKKMRKTFNEIVQICKPSMSNDYFVLMDTLLFDTKKHIESLTKEDFKKFDNEVLIFFSKEDTIFTETMKENLVNLMTNPTVIEDLKGGHLALMQSINEYTETLNKFIKERN